MKELDLEAELQFINAAEVMNRDGCHIPLRFPSDVLSGMESEEMAKVAKMQSGIELQLPPGLDKAEVIFELLDTDDYGIIGEWFSGPHKNLPNCIFNKGPGDYSFAVDVPESCRVYPLRFLFPTHCTLGVKSVRISSENDQIEFDPYTHCANQSAKNWIVYGDSITHGANTSVPSTTWVNQAAMKLGVRVLNLGIGGYGKAETIIAEYMSTLECTGLISLHMGANFSPLVGEDPQYDPVEVRELFSRFLRILRSRRKHVPIVMVTPVLNLGWDVSFISELLKEVYSDFSDDQNLHLHDGHDFLNHKSSLTTDGAHLSDLGQIEYAEKLSPVFKKFL